MFHVPNKYRVTKGMMGSDPSYGNNGMFLIPNKTPRAGGVANPMTVIASDGEFWEHVSVSYQNRCPNWDEMCKIKDIFWDPDDAVMQLHPPQSEYVNNHPYCLHLWRKAGTNDFFESPPLEMVGIK